MKNKGFTLTELLVTLVVLGIISAIAIPNVSGILEDNRINVVIEDANKMYETVKAMEATKKIEKPKDNNDCTVVTLNYLDKEDNFKTTAGNGTYDKNNSYVIIKKAIIGSNTIKYEYYITLIEEDDSNISGLKGVNYSELGKEKYETDISEYDIETLSKKAEINCSEYTISS